MPPSVSRCRGCIRASFLSEALLRPSLSIRFPLSALEKTVTAKGILQAGFGRVLATAPDCTRGLEPFLPVHLRGLADLLAGFLVSFKGPTAVLSDLFFQCPPILLEVGTSCGILLFL